MNFPNICCPDMTNDEVLGPFLQEKDARAEWGRSRWHYVWWRWIGKTFKPTRFLELGVRYAYTAFAMLRAETPLKQYVGIDIEMDEPDCLNRVDLLLKEHYPSVQFFPVRRNSQKINSLHECAVDGLFPLVHVDADHHALPALRDLRLAWDVVKPGGILVVDDMAQNTVRSLEDDKGDTGVAIAVHHFLREINQPLVWLPSASAIGLIRKPE